MIQTTKRNFERQIDESGVKDSWHSNFIWLEIKWQSSSSKARDSLSTQQYCYCNKPSRAKSQHEQSMRKMLEGKVLHQKNHHRKKKSHHRVLIGGENE